MTMAANDQPAALEKLRNVCLARGAHGIKGLGRMFRIYDDNGNKKLSYTEFREGLRDYDIRELPDREIQELFFYFDKDKSGCLSFDEFLLALRPPMDKSRVDIVKKAFAKIDADSSGVLTIDDLKRRYRVDHDPRYLNGELTKKQVFQQFLNNYQTDGDDKVTFEEFLNYYSGVSASIDQDVYFDYMMRQAWNL